jgi:hypothetical protein
MMVSNVTWSQYIVSNSYVIAASFRTQDSTHREFSLEEPLAVLSAPCGLASFDLSSNDEVQLTTPGINKRNCPTEKHQS